MMDKNADRQHVVEKIPDLVSRRQAELGIDDASLADFIGYGHPKVIAMVKTGAMRLPINKALPLADALKVPRLDMLRAALMDQSPELWSVISELLPLGELTDTEVNLVRHLRRLTNGRAASPMVLDGAGVIALVANP